MTSPNQKESSPRLYNNIIIAVEIFIYVQQTFAHAEASQPAITTEPCIPPTGRIQTNTWTTHEDTRHDESRSQKIDAALIDIKARTTINSSRDPRDTHRRRVEPRGTKHHSHQDRNIAGGVIAGAGLAELVHHQKKKNGDHVSHRVGHLVRTVGAGPLGAVAANELTKAHEAHRANFRMTDMIIGMGMDILEDF